MAAKLILSEAKIEEFASLGLTDREIADLTEIDPKAYQKAILKGRARLHQTLRRAQLKSALRGNASMLIFLGKVYLNQKEAIDHNVSATHQAIAITPNVLERLQTSYKLTMEQVRARAGGPAPLPGEGPRGVPGDRGVIQKTAPLSGNFGISNGGAKPGSGCASGSDRGGPSERLENPL
jgi:hypothetical protein